MKKVQLADRLGNIETKRVGYSYLHLILGPIYSLIRGKIIVGILELIFIYYFAPIPGMEWFANFISSLNFIPEGPGKIIYDVLVYFRVDSHYYLGIIILFFMDLYISAYIESWILKKYMKKKQLLPVDEKDARILIRNKVCNVKVGLSESFDLRTTQDYKKAEESWLLNNESHLKKNSPSYASRSELKNSSDQRIRIQLDQLQNSYRLGLISKEEYDEKYKALLGE